MSLVLPQLRGLSLDSRKMPTTRSQTRKGSDKRRSKPLTSRRESDAPPFPQAPLGNAATTSRPPPHGRIRNTNLNSSQTNLSPASPSLEPSTPTEKVTYGRSSHVRRPSVDDYAVELCSEEQSPSSSYYAFQIRPKSAQQTVRIGSPRSPYRTPHCSCQFYQNNATPCTHIFWLLEQLTGSENSNEIDPDAADNPSEDQLSAFKRISAQGLADLATRNDWPLKTPPRERFEAANSSDPRSSIRDQMRDILSTFDSNGNLPEDYMTGQLDISSDEESDSDPLVPDDLSATILRLSLKDNNVFHSLRQAVTSDYCAASYFDKLSRLVASTFKRYRNIPPRPTGLAIYGVDSLTPTQPSTHPPLTINECESHLRTIEQKLIFAIESRAPLSESTRLRALQVLIGLLDGVSQTDPTLLARLLGNTSFSADSDSNTQRRPFFVLDALWLLADVARDAVDILDEIQARIEQRGVLGAYLREFQNLVDSLQSVTTKRRAAGEGFAGERSKRMK